jgi:hypothetical protein
VPFEGCAAIKALKYVHLAFDLASFGQKINQNLTKIKQKRLKITLFSVI